MFVCNDTVNGARIDAGYTSAHLVDNYIIISLTYNMALRYCYLLFLSDPALISQLTDLLLQQHVLALISRLAVSFNRCIWTVCNSQTKKSRLIGHINVISGLQP